MHHCECFMLEYISLSTGLVPNRFDYMRFSVGLWISYVNRGETVQVEIIQSFIYRGIYYFTKPIEGAV